MKDMISFAHLVIEISLETARLKFRDGMSQKIRGFVSKTVSRPKIFPLEIMRKEAQLCS